MSNDMTRVLLTKRFSAQPQHLKTIRSEISNTLSAHGFNQDFQSDMVLAVDEACQNIIRHAYQFDDHGIIDLSLMLDHNELCIELIDFATTVDPDCCKPKECKDELTPGGLGTLIMNKVMDSVAYECPPPNGAGNKLVMRRKVEHSER